MNNNENTNHNQTGNHGNLKDKLKEKLPIIPEVSSVSPDKIIMDKLKKIYN